jgi:HlyD family secretion protein
VVGPREPLLDVVPTHEKLVISARIAPQDIEHLRVGGTAEVRLIGGDARQRTPLPARVAFVSPDRMSDASGQRVWFEVTVEVDRAAVREQAPALQLQPGMPAELYVTTAERTLIEYLAKPLGLFTQRALREP